MNTTQGLATSGEIERNVAANTTYCRGTIATHDGKTRITVESSDPEVAGMLRHAGYLGIEIKRVSMLPDFADLVKEARMNGENEHQKLLAAFAAGDEAASNPPANPAAVPTA